MNKIRTIIISILLITISYLITACSFFSKQLSYTSGIKNISTSVDFRTIVTQGYMGGSLIYNEENISIGQLAENVSVAIRLSKAEYKDIDNYKIFHEIDYSTIYGLLIIDSIDKNHIEFSIILYDKYGFESTNKKFNIISGSKIDINDDGFYDLEYNKPIQKRHGYEKSMYLTFLSSQEDLNITMFAILKEQYPNEDYPNGIIGVNPDGRFIIQKYSDKDTSVRSVVTGVYSGDYVMDNKNAIYQRVITNKYTRHSRAISDSDLETMISEEGVETFYFTESDFAFINPNDLISVLPLEITEKYESEGIEKLNNILEDKTLLYTIDALQGSVIPADYKSEVFEQFASLNTEEIVQINRCFLEENYSTICPQRVTVSKAIIEILPLASVVLSESDLYECPIDYDEIGDAQREASASWREANSKKEYEQMLAEMEGKLKRYKILLIDEKLNFPVTTQETEKDKFKLNSSVGITNSRLVLGITGSFDLTWTNAYSSVEVVAFFKSQAGIDVSFSRKDKEIKKISDNLQYTSDPNEKSERGEFGKIYNPITKKSLPIIDWEKSHTMNLISYPVGPVVFGINLIFKFGLPVELNFELNTNITYDAYIAGMASAGVSASLNFEFKTYKKWIFTLLKINVDGSGDKWAYADAIYYVDFSGNSLSANFNQLSVNFTVRPFMKCDLDASISGMLHAGLKFKEELSGYIKFGYYKPKVYGSFGLNNNTEFALYTFIGVKNVKFLGKNLGDVGKTWEWPPIRESIPLIKETIFFEKEF